MSIKIKKWNSGKGMTEKMFEIPTNVVNINAFADAVQCAVDYFTNDRLSYRIDSAYKAYESESKKTESEPARLEKLYKEYREALEEHEAFRAVVSEISVPHDTFAVAYTVSVVGIGSHLTVTGFYDTYVEIVRYGHDYQIAGLDKWSNTRKEAFATLKQHINEVLVSKFQIKERTKEEKDAGKEITYKPFDPSFNNREVERIVSAVYGKIEIATGNAKTSGTALKHMTEEQAFVYIIREMFHKYGCAVDTSKKKKVSFVF